MQLMHMELSPLAYVIQYRTMPDASCINTLQDSFWIMRLRLLEFIVQIHKAFELPEEALFLSVNLLDRYCCCSAIAGVHFQLVGCTALLIAAKYEVSSGQETPSLKELESACCFLYSTAMFKEMEWSILKALDWAVGHPVAYTFLQMALAECTRDCQLEHLSMYIAEIALFYKEFTCVVPSTLATAALALASHILRPTASSLTYVYDPHVFVNLLRRLYQPPQVLVAKYASKQLSNVSAIVLKFLQPQVFTRAGGDTSNAEPKTLGDR